MREVIPALIQDDPEFAERASLVLIHDGGGTTINYYFLDDIDRPVWGIANEGLVDDGAWPGGIKQLAGSYIKTILSELKPGPVIFGGWSVGGLIALEMARSFTKNQDFTLLGVIMIDTFRPSISGTVVNQDTASIEWGEATTQESKEKTIKSIANCSQFSRQWAQKSSVDVTTAERIPPIILLRANGSKHQGVIDNAQEQWSLGWEKHEQDFFSRILEIPGDHYNLFSDQNVEGLTQSLAEACTSLEDTRGKGAISH